MFILQSFVVTWKITEHFQVAAQVQKMRIGLWLAEKCMFEGVYIIAI